MKLPKVRHKIVRSVAKDLYLCTDQRSSDVPRFEGSSAGGGYLYYLHKESNHEQKIAKNDRRLLRKWRSK